MRVSLSLFPGLKLHEAAHLFGWVWTLPLAVAGSGLPLHCNARQPTLGTILVTDNAAFGVRRGRHRCTSMPGPSAVDHIKPEQTSDALFLAEEVLIPRLARVFGASDDFRAIPFN
jgi:hypothetical protein